MTDSNEGRGFSQRAVRAGLRRFFGFLGDQADEALKKAEAIETEGTQSPEGGTEKTPQEEAPSKGTLGSPVAHGTRETP